MASYKKTFKERFESATFFTAASMPFLGLAGGAWIGATSALSSGVGLAIGLAIGLGVAGAAGGFVAGAVVGAAGFFAANAIYKNKEYIALAATFVAIAPFALAGRGLKNLGQKIKSLLPKRDTPAAEKGNTKATPQSGDVPPAASLPSSGTVTKEFKAGADAADKTSSAPANSNKAPSPQKSKMPPPAA